MKTVYSPNSTPAPSSNIEIVVDTLRVEEVAFTLVTNKKDKEKVKAPFSPSTNFRSKILLVL